MNYSDRHYCVTCGHGYGVHEAYEGVLRIRKGEVEVFPTQWDYREVCTGYPDKMGECECAKFERPVQ